MHNLKEIRKNFDLFEKELQKRSTDVDFLKIKNLDLKNKNTIIIVTHEPALFEGIPSRILFLEKGKIKNFMKENHEG